jgi:hypothetical protein
MEQTYKVQIITADNYTHIEEIKAINELEALDIAHVKYTDILDIKVVK